MNKQIFKICKAASLLGVFLTINAGSDELFSEYPELERKHLIQKVLMRNPDLFSVQESIETARHRSINESRLPDPYISGTVAPLTFASGTPGYKVGIKQSVPFPGKLGLKEKIRGADVEKNRARYKSLQIKLALAASNLYSHYFIISQTLEVNHHHQSRMKKLIESARVKYQTGQSGQQYLVQAQIAYENTRQKEWQIKTELHTVKIKLNQLLHRDPQATLPPPPTELLKVSHEYADKVDGNLAASNHPDLKIIEAEKEKAGHSIRLAMKESRPNLDLLAGYNNMWMNTDHRFTVGLGLNLPIIPSKRKSDILKSKSQLKSLEKKYASTQNRIAAGQSTRQQQILESKKILEHYSDKLMPLCETHVRLTRIDYESGKSDLESILNSTNHYKEVILNYTRAQAEYFNRIAALMAVRGEIPFYEKNKGEHK